MPTRLIFFMLVRYSVFVVVRRRLESFRLFDQGHDKEQLYSEPKQTGSYA
jgi:hypothetical protein